MNSTEELIHESNFQSLTKLGVNWNSLIKNSILLSTKYKELIQAQKNWLLVSIDYSAIEMAVLASLSGDISLITAINAKMDPHNMNVEKMYSCSYSKIE